MDGAQERGRRAMVVDDESLIRWSIREALTCEGFEVCEADTAASAIRLASGAAPFDVILLDLRPPDSMGLELLERLRLISPASKVIVMSAYDTAEMHERGSRLGASAFLAKPFRLDDLVYAVAAA